MTSASGWLLAVNGEHCSEASSSRAILTWSLTPVPQPLKGGRIPPLHPSAKPVHRVEILLLVCSHSEQSRAEGGLLSSCALPGGDMGAPWGCPWGQGSAPSSAFALHPLTPALLLLPCVSASPVQGQGEWKALHASGIPVMPEPQVELRGKTPQFPVLAGALQWSCVLGRRWFLLVHPGKGFPMDSVSLLAAAVWEAVGMLPWSVDEHSSPLAAHPHGHCVDSRAALGSVPAATAPLQSVHTPWH